MIKTNPDLLMSPARLAREIEALEAEVATRAWWRVREKYIDQGRLDPHYLIDIQPVEAAAGDDLAREPLYATRHAGLRIKHMTREPGDRPGDYWRAIRADALTGRLRRFLSMYCDDYLQPPGRVPAPHSRGPEHRRFPSRRYLYQIRSPLRTLTGIGSRMFSAGALRGRVTAADGTPVAGATVTLTAGDQSLVRSTDRNGRFLFSQAPPGRHTIAVETDGVLLTSTGYEPFGDVRGSVRDEHRRAIEGVGLVLTAPDGETVEYASSRDGSFHGDLPEAAFELRVPERSFVAQVGGAGDEPG